MTGSYAAEVGYLKSWVSQRMNLLDSSIDSIGGSASGGEATPGSDDEVITSLYPTPAWSRFEFTVSLPSSQRVRISLHDMLGRRVRTVPARFLGNDSTHRFAISVDGLASGMYILRLTGDRDVATRSVAVIGR